VNFRLIDDAVSPPDMKIIMMIIKVCNDAVLTAVIQHQMSSRKRYGRRQTWST
jgi:hypothetical protein